MENHQHLNNKICALPWLGQSINLEGNITPCGLSDKTKILLSEENLTIESIVNSNEMKKLRSNMLSNIASEHCKVCYANEACQNESLRETSNKNLNQELLAAIKNTSSDGHIHNPKSLFLTIRASNVCNFKCRTCSCEYSTTWYEDALKIKKNLNQSKINAPIRNIIEKIYPIVKEAEGIYFAGGEPFLQEEFYKIINYILSEKTHIKKIIVNTNFSTLTFKDQKCYHLLKALSDKDKDIDVQLIISIDAPEKQNAIIRHGSNWNLMQKNLFLLNTIAPKAISRYQTTISIYNVFHLPNLIEDLFLQRRDREFDSELFNLNFVHHPNFLSVSILNTLEVKQIIDHYQGYIARWEQNHLKNACGILNSVIKTLEGNIMNKHVLKLRHKMHHYNQQLDILRHEDTRLLFTYDTEKDLISYAIT